MREYCSAYLTKNIEISQGSEGAKGAEAPSAPFAPSVPRDIPENFSLEVPSAPFAPSVDKDIPETLLPEVVPSAPFAPLVDRDIPEDFSLEVPSAPFAPSVIEDITETFSSEDLVLAPEDVEQFFYEIEERIAIMMYDGGMREEEAEERARADVQSAWQRSKVELAKLSSLEPII